LYYTFLAETEKIQKLHFLNLTFLAVVKSKTEFGTDTEGVAEVVVEVVAES
jgi:hypothetical protein